MELKNFTAQDAEGNVIAGAVAHLYLPGTDTPAAGLKDAQGAPLANPFVATSQGQLQFAAPDGVYDLHVTGAGRTTTMRVQFIDAAGIRDKMDEVLDALAATPVLPDQTGKAGGALMTDGEAPDWSPAYTKDEVDARFSTKDEVGAEFYTKSQVDAGFYTKDQVNTIAGGRANADLGNVTQANARAKVGTGTMAYRNFTISTGDPAGGVNGDVHFKV